MNTDKIQRKEPELTT